MSRIVISIDRDLPINQESQSPQSVINKLYNDILLVPYSIDLTTLLSNFLDKNLHDDQIYLTYLEGRKDAKVQQDESYPSTGDLPVLNASRHAGFVPDTHRVASLQY